MDIDDGRVATIPTSATMTIEIHAGSPIRRASHDAQRIADLLGINVEFKFNDVTCLAQPGGDGELLAERQQHEQARKMTLANPYDRKFASSRLSGRAAGDAQGPSHD